MNKFFRLSLFALALIGICSACSKDNDNPTPEMKNWMKAGERKTEIKMGLSNVRDLDEWVNLTFAGAGITFDKKADGSLDSESVKGVGDFIDVEIWGLDKVTPGTYTIAKKKPTTGSNIGATATYVQDLNVAASKENEDENVEFVGVYVGTFTKGTVSVAKSGDGYLIKIDGECVDENGVTKKVTLQYDDKLENVVIEQLAL